MAFLIYDRTGAICVEQKGHYQDLSIIQASPAGTHFTASNAKYSFSVEQMASRAICAKSRHDPRAFASETARFFETTLRLLEVPVLNRVGLRQLYFKTFPKREDANQFIQTLNLEYETTDDHFGISTAATEYVSRWESEGTGVLLHVAGLPGTVAANLVDVFQIEEGFEKTYQSVVVLDVDFYTKLPVLQSRWQSTEWILQSSHVIKKGLRKFLEQCQPH